MRILAVFLAMFCAAAHAEEAALKWVQLDEHSLQRKCNDLDDMLGKVNRPSVYAGCYHKSGGICTIYTRKGDPLAERFQRTVGHETLHCFLGRFHD